MAIYDLHSKRQKRLRGQLPDVYTYDDFPESLRNQIVHIWRDLLSGADDDGSLNARIYAHMGKIIAREYGLETFPEVRKDGQFRGNSQSSTVENFRNVFVINGNFDLVLDITELSFRTLISEANRRYGPNNWQVVRAVDELNHRFQEHGVGYQYIDIGLIRIDSELIHSEVVKPALRLLNQPQYAGAQQEFLKAHEHYRKADYKEAMTECAKSLESVLKSICDKNAWKYEPTATAKPLIKICLDKGLIPPFWENHFSSLRTMLESSVPTGRNKMAAHGQGATPTEVPGYLVAYMLHMTASTIVFLAEAEAALLVPAFSGGPK